MTNEDVFTLFLDAEYQFYCLELIEKQGEDYVINNIDQISQEFVEMFKKLPDSEVEIRYEAFMEVFGALIKEFEDTEKSSD